LPDIKGKDVEMELLLVIASIAAFVLLVKHTKAKGRISELMLNLQARQLEIKDLELEVVRLRGDLQVQLQSCSASSRS
jgi:hypothetical protein